MKNFRDFNPLACLLTLTLAALLAGCEQQSDKEPGTATGSGQKPLPATATSDPKAVEIANAVMEACGGRANWEATRYVTWRFFDKRLNVWDKLTDDVRIESRGSIVLMNLRTMKGRAWKDNDELFGDDLTRALDYGYEAWVNDSYWMFMPFKLTDDGVTLKYIGEAELENGQMADVLSVTFSNVGVTPENKYHVYVDRQSHLMVRWDFYMDASDEYPRFTTPWKNYERHGKILLSGDRGEKQNTDIAVFDELPPSVFNSPEPIEWEQLNIDQLNI